MKRLFDFTLSFLGLVIFSPIFLILAIIIWLNDFSNPFFIADRVGLNGKMYKMIKLRTMVIDAEKSGVDSTSASDPRITGVGRFIRKFKLDELPQLWNVFLGQMSFVGPRPNVKRETDLYSKVEKGLLKTRPGITDFSSIVFSDLAEILKDSEDPNLDYNQLVRPWKSRLGLVYIEKGSFILDLKLIVLTLIAIFSTDKAIQLIISLLVQVEASPEIINVVRREKKLVPTPPPGMDSIITFR